MFSCLRTCPNNSTTSPLLDHLLSSIFVAQKYAFAIDVESSVPVIQSGYDNVIQMHGGCIDNSYSRGMASQYRYLHSLSSMTAERVLAVNDAIVQRGC